MGIKGFHKYLHDVENRVHISELRGKRVGIDTYCWLHRAVVTCGLELAMGHATKKHVQYVVNRVRVLQNAGIIPIMVFDGAAVPLKKDTNDSRAQRREAALQRGMELYRLGDITAATSYFEKSVNITPQMAHDTIQAMMHMGIQCIVAPFEADAQLAYLARTHYIDVVVTEDSDLLVYGSPVVWYKMDKDGYAVELTYDRVKAFVQRDICPTGDEISSKQLQSMCVLSGCDYVSSLPGVGIKKAGKLISSFLNIDEIVTSLRREGKVNMTQTELKKYADDFERALYCFAHHIVWDPVEKCLRTFEPLAPGAQLQTDIVGTLYDREKATKVCSQILLDPITFEPYLTNASGTSGRQTLMTDYMTISMRAPPFAMVSSSQNGSSASLREVISKTSPESRPPQTKVVSRFFASQQELPQPATPKAQKVIIIHDTQSETQPSAASTCSPPEEEILTPHVPLTTRCPHGNPSCTTSHSVFLQCPAPTLPPPAVTLLTEAGGGNHHSQGSSSTGRKGRADFHNLSQAVRRSRTGTMDIVSTIESISKRVRVDSSQQTSQPAAVEHDAAPLPQTVVKPRTATEMAQFLKLHTYTSKQ